MTFFILATVRTPPPVVEAPRYESRNFWIETMDGAARQTVSLDGDVLPVLAQRGLLGLGVNPSEVQLAGTPGVAGASVTGVQYEPRPVALPLLFVGEDGSQAALWRAVQSVRDITDPGTGMTHDGSFRLVCSSASGVRRLGLAYRSGLEGEDKEYPGVETAVLDCVAPQPFPEDEAETSREFRLAAVAEPFLTATTGTTFPWGTRKLSPSTVIGSDMPLVMTSAVPVFPTVEIDGPADSVLITADTGLRIDVPAGVPAGQTLRIVTDPRGASIRLDGVPAAGMLARGSKRAPFKLGTNVLDVTAPGASADTRLRLSWRGKYRSLW